MHSCQVAAGAQECTGQDLLRRSVQKVPRQVVWELEYGPGVFQGILCLCHLGERAEAVVSTD